MKNDLTLQPQTGNSGSKKVCKKRQCGNSSVVEHHLAKVGVAGPNPVFRSTMPRWWNR